jgi:hypothetical protein
VCRTSFKDVGKGWYNLAESNFEAYRFSKLRRFLGLVRFGMEDSLRYLVEGSISKFVTFMQVRHMGWGWGRCFGLRVAACRSPLTFLRACTFGPC